MIVAPSFFTSFFPAYLLQLPGILLYFCCCIFLLLLLLSLCLFFFFSCSLITSAHELCFPSNSFFLCVCFLFFIDLLLCRLCKRASANGLFFFFFLIVYACFFPTSLSQKALSFFFCLFVVFIVLKTVCSSVLHE